MLFFFRVSNCRNFTRNGRKSSNSSKTIKIIAMRTLVIIVATALTALTSCSVYRSGQTPDDVYYSPGKSKEGAAYVQATGDRDDGRRYNDRERSYYGYDDYATPEDRWLMMRVRNRYRWSMFDDYNYYSPYNSWYYSPYNSWSYGVGYGYPGIGLGFGYYDPFGYSRFNDYYYWNSYYNPYCPKFIVVNPKTDPAAYNKIRNFNMNTYNNRNYSNTRSLNNPHVTRPGNQGYNNNNRTLGNSFRRVFSNSNNATVTPRNQRDTYRPSNESYSRPSNDRPTRVYSPSSSNNSTYSPRSSGNSGNNSGSSSSGSSSGSRPSRR
jgi:hypothetical protein